MKCLRSNDTISARQGKATAIINGLVQDMFYVKNVEANIDKDKAEVKTMGCLATRHKTIGWSGTGSMTMHYVTSFYRELLNLYTKTGIDTYFTLTLTNEDPTSDTGRQTVVLYNVNLDGGALFKADAEGDILEEDVDFTFDNFDIIEIFNPLV